MIGRVMRNWFGCYQSSFVMLWTCITPLIKIRPANPKIPVGPTGITNPLNLLEHPKFAVNVTFFVRHKLFLHPNSGNLEEVPREQVHIYCAPLAINVSSKPKFKQNCCHHSGTFYS
jgi:hypothetical protein